MNRSLLTINNSILLNQSQINNVRPIINIEEGLPVQKFKRLRSSDPNDKFQIRSLKIHDLLFCVDHDKENANQN
jgi:hypothetical protein